MAEEREPINSSHSPFPIPHSALLAGFPVVIEFDVAWGDMDAFQHVSNLVYFRYFQDARIEYFRRVGWIGGSGEFGGIGPIVHSTSARFRKAVTYPDRVAAGARVVNLESDRFTVEHRLVSAKAADVASEGQALIVSFDYVRGQKAPIPDLLRARIERMEKG
jgi:acyl-CoA thioester hydrolase